MLPDNCYPVNATLYQHQCQAADASLTRLEDGGGATLLMEMGTGKTLTSIAIVGQLWKERRIRKVLIVAPLSILGVWEEEFQKIAAFGYEMTVLTGSLTHKAETIRSMSGPSLQVLVVNYESAWRLETELLHWHPECIIADECHKIKTPGARASKAIHKLGAAAKYRLALTGTVITNKPIDVFSQYKFANPSVFGGSFYLFRNRYFDMVGYGKYTPVMKQTMETEFTQRLHSIAFRATKAECLDLPDTTDVIQRVDLEPIALRGYRQMVKNSYTELQDGAVTVTNVLTRLLRLSQLTGGFLGSDEDPRPEQVSSAKLDALEEVLESADGQKLVIIARFIPEIHAIEQMLTRKGIRYSIIHGGVTDRAAQVTAFQTDPTVQVFIGQIATAGLGITLTAASTMVFYSLDYSMSNYEQTKARIHRVGQRHPCTYIHLVARGTVDEQVLKALKDKADLAKTLVDDCRAGRNPFDPYRRMYAAGKDV
ncbi:MAG: DEAD/DEAH box helicase [Candidatus Limiplasma sp.]|nr:DEAD/DEAH box helicase [Candidatus Limiplasma sp.]